MSKHARARAADLKLLIFINTVVECGMDRTTMPSRLAAVD
jgi:hypothetical protein